MKTMTGFTRALLFATEKHDNQYRRDGAPYIYHPVSVADTVRQLGYDEKYQIVAILHDVLEDTDATEEELRQMFDDDIVDAVVLLTRAKGMDEEEYVNRILTNHMAAVVKNIDKIQNICDAVHPGKTGTEWKTSDKEFAKKYVEKAKKYYDGKFSQNLDDAIGGAEWVLCNAEIEAKMSCDIESDRIRLHSDVEKERKEFFKKFYESGKQPNLSSDDIQFFYKNDDLYCDENWSANKWEEHDVWHLTKAGWYPCKLHILDWADDIYRATREEAAEEIEYMKEDGYFYDFFDRELT